MSRAAGLAVFWAGRGDHVEMRGSQAGLPKQNDTASGDSVSTVGVRGSARTIAGGARVSTVGARGFARTSAGGDCVSTVGARGFASTSASGASVSSVGVSKRSDRRKRPFTLL